MSKLLFLEELYHEVVLVDADGTVIHDNRNGGDPVIRRVYDDGKVTITNAQDGRLLASYSLAESVDLSSDIPVPETSLLVQYKRLRRVMEWYADEQNYNQEYAPGYPTYDGEVARWSYDGGQRARTVLKALPELPKSRKETCHEILSRYRVP
jgi:hypothetical protein